jgi:hypothetical protein
MTKKQLQEMITVAVRKVVKEEIKPLLEATIKKEFFKILSEAETAKPKKEMMVEEYLPETSLMNLVEQDQETDEARSEINERIFKGKNPFADVLNQTADDVKNRSGIYANPLKQDGKTQKKMVINQPVPTQMVNEGAVATPRPTREQLAAQIGYGDMNKIGVSNNIPTVESTQPVEVELPAMSAGGEGGAPKPIDYNNVPVELVQNMMKNYSGLMKKVETKVRRPE